MKWHSRLQMLPRIGRHLMKFKLHLHPFRKSNLIDWIEFKVVFHWKLSNKPIWKHAEEPTSKSMGDMEGWDEVRREKGRGGLSGRHVQTSIMTLSSELQVNPTNMKYQWYNIKYARTTAFWTWCQKQNKTLSTSKLSYQCHMTYIKLKYLRKISNQLCQPPLQYFSRCQ